PEGAGGTAPCLHAPEKIGIERFWWNERGIEKLRIDIGGNRACADHSAARDHDAGCPLLFDQNFSDLRASLDFDAMFGSGLRHGLRDRSHAADGVTPRPLFTIHFTKRMVQKNVSGARCVWTRIISDDGIKPQPCFDQLALEPAVQEITCRFCKEIKHAIECFGGKPANPVTETRGLEYFADRVCTEAAAQIGRRLQQQAAQETGGSLDLSIEGVKPFPITTTEPRHIALGGAFRDKQVFPIERRNKILRAPF